MHRGYPADIGLCRLGPSLAGLVTSADRTGPISLRPLRLPRLKLSRRVRFTNRFTYRLSICGFRRLSLPSSRLTAVLALWPVGLGSPRDRATGLALIRQAAKMLPRGRPRASRVIRRRLTTALQRVPATEDRKRRGGTLCLEVPGNASGIVRDVGKYLPVTRC